MNSKTSNRALPLLAFAALLSVVALSAQAPSAQATASRFLGSITAITGDTLTVKTDTGEVHQVEVPSSASLKRIAPGQKDLSTAATIQFSDLASGDRVLVRLDPNATGATPQALQIIAIKQADVAQKQKQDQEDWQRNGVGGLVKSVDPSSGVVVISSGAGPTAKTVTIHVSKATIIKRYAPASVQFDQAQPAPIDAIHAGDQLRARGQKNADGTSVDAAEVVSGSFRSISGTVTAIDTAASTLTVRDLATKKTVTIHITPQVEMHRLPDIMAKMIAARLKGSTGTGTGSGAMGSPRSQGGTGGAGQAAGGQASSGQRGTGAGAGQARGGDMEQILTRAPAIQLGDLQKGEAVMLVSTDGTSEVTAIKLLAGVEPLLEAPASQDLLSNWSMGSGGAEAAAQ
jgi:hypothetical protein